MRHFEKVPCESLGKGDFLRSDRARARRNFETFSERLRCALVGGEDLTIVVAEFFFEAPKGEGERAAVAREGEECIVEDKGDEEGKETPPALTFFAAGGAVLPLRRALA